MTSSLIRHYYVIDNVMSHNELVNGIFLRPRSSWNIFFQRYLWTPVKNVTFLVLRNTFFWLFENFFQILTQKCFSTKLRSWWFLIGYNRVPAISLSKNHFVWFLGFQLFVSCHLIGQQVSWSGLWLVHLMITGHMTFGLSNTLPYLHGRVG